MNWHIRLYGVVCLIGFAAALGEFSHPFAVVTASIALVLSLVALVVIVVVESLGVGAQTRREP